MLLRWEHTGFRTASFGSCEGGGGRSCKGMIDIDEEADWGLAEHYIETGLK